MVVACVVRVYQSHYGKFFCCKLIAVKNEIAAAPTVITCAEADAVDCICAQTFVNVYFRRPLSIQISYVGVCLVTYVSVIHPKVAGEYYR